MPHPIATALGAVAGVGAACFAWGLVEARLHTLRRVDVAVLPPGSPALKVLHLSDLHLLSRQRGKLDFLRSLAALEPDLVVNTGDNIAEGGAIGPLTEALGPLLRIPGVFVFGSNDYHAPQFKNPARYLIDGRSHLSEHPAELPWRELRDALETHGWLDIMQRRATLEIGGLRLAFRGTDDGHLDRDDYGAVAGPADPSAALTIGVTHAPYARLLDAMEADGLELILAGHTHGGQVCLPGFGALTTNCDLPPAQAKGLSRHGSAYLHVSGGLGTSPFAPYRFANRPEATLLTLRPRPA